LDKCARDVCHGRCTDPEDRADLGVRFAAHDPARHLALPLISHDDNYVGDATYTLFDDVTTQ